MVENQNLKTDYFQKIYINKKMSNNNTLNRLHTTPELFMDTPITYSGPMYTPVTHRQVIETVEGYLDSKNIPIMKQHYLTDKHGVKAVGVLVIDTIDADMSFEIAWRNSLDGSMSFQVVSGSEVRVCSNTNIWGDIAVKRKHFGNKASEEIINNVKYAIDSYQEVIDVHLKNREILLNETIDLTTSAQLVGRLFIEESLITATQMSIIKREIENPSFDYNAQNSLYELHNHCTHALKESHPRHWLDQHKGVGNFFVNYALDNRSPIVNIPFQSLEGQDYIYTESTGSDDLVGVLVTNGIDELGAI